MRVRKLAATAALVAAIGATLTVGAGAALAQQTGATLPVAGPPKGPTPRRADGHPDLSGVWRRRGDPSINNVVGKAFSNGIGADGQSQSVTRDGNFNDLEVDAEYIVKSSQDMPQYKPEFWDQIRKNEEFGYRTGADPMYGCKNPGVVRLDTPVEVFQSAQKVTLIYANPIDDPTSGHIWVREVPTDGRPLPKPDDYQGLVPTGTSSGHWDGDTLVIETVDFPGDGAVWYNLRGWPSSPETKVTERIRRDGDHLYYDQTVDDPAFIKPWVRPQQVSTLDANPNAILPQPLSCVELDAARLPGTK